MLGSALVTLGDRILKVTKVTDVEGEVSTNVRKGKIRQIYDLTISLTAKESDSDNEKPIRIVDYMSDTERKNFEMDFGSLDRAWREPLKEACWNILMEFRKDVEEVHGKSLLVNAPTIADEPGKGEMAGIKPKFNGVFDDKKDLQPQGASKFEEIIGIPAPSDVVFSMLTEADKIRSWSRGSANVATIEPGASFTMLNGNILCTVVKIESGPVSRLVMDWRLKHWQSSQWSTVDICVKRSSNNPNTSQIVLKQDGVPTAEMDSVKENWHRYYWEPIKTLMGCPSYSII